MQQSILLDIKSFWMEGSQVAYLFVSVWAKEPGTCIRARKQASLVTSLITPFENPQRWMGQNTFPILLLNDDNMIGEHQKTRMKMLYGCPFEKNEKEVFFRLTTFFFRNKNFFFREQLQFSFLCITMQKKNFGAIQKKFF